MYNDAKRVWEMYEPVAECPRIDCVGSVGDGGKYICNANAIWLNRVESPDLCAIYSFGSAGDSSFEAYTRCRTD